MDITGAATGHRPRSPRSSASPWPSRPCCRQLREDHEASDSAASSSLFALYSGLLVMTLTICFLQLTTVQALRAIGMLVLGGVGLTF